MPKSGTTWLEDLLSQVPGYRKRAFRDSDGCTSLRHDVCDEVFASLPEDLLCVLKLHTTAAPRNLEVINRHINKTVVMYRDLRDQCVSRYHDVLTRVDHQDHDRYREWSLHEGMNHCIDVTLEHYVPWLSDWIAVLARDPRYRGLRYEDLRGDTDGELSRVLEFYGIDLPSRNVAAIVERVRSATRFELTPETLAAGSTARKGIVGDWRNNFTVDHVERFKRGAGELLVELGYERDLDWAL